MQLFQAQALDAEQVAPLGRPHFFAMVLQTFPVGHSEDSQQLSGMFPSMHSALPTGGEKAMVSPSQSRMRPVACSFAVQAQIVCPRPFVASDVNGTRQ